MRDPVTTDVDRYVGTRIRLRRRERGLALIDLADRVGVAPSKSRSTRRARTALLSPGSSISPRRSTRPSAGSLRACLFTLIGTRTVRSIF